MATTNTKTYGSRTYTYSAERALMEWNDEEFGNLYSIGLSADNFNDNPDYWFEVFHERVNEELSYMW